MCLKQLFLEAVETVFIILQLTEYPMANKHGMLYNRAALSLGSIKSWVKKKEVRLLSITGVEVYFTNSCPSYDLQFGIIEAVRQLSQKGWAFKTGLAGTLTSEYRTINIGRDALTRWQELTLITLDRATFQCSVIEFMGIFMHKNFVPQYYFLKFTYIWTCCWARHS